MNINDDYLDHFMQSIIAYQKKKSIFRNNILKKILKIYNRTYNLNCKKFNEIYLEIKMFIDIRNIIFVGDTVLFISDFMKIYWFGDRFKLSNISILILIQCECKYDCLYIFHLQFNSIICTIIENYAKSDVKIKSLYVKNQDKYNVDHIELCDGKIYGEIESNSNMKSANKT